MRHGRRELTFVHMQLQLEPRAETLCIWEEKAMELNFRRHESADDRGQSLEKLGDILQRLLTQYGIDQDQPTAMERPVYVREELELVA